MKQSLKTPLLVVNFKVYSAASGIKALEMAKIHEKIARERGVSVAIAVQAVDLKRIADEVEIPVFAQHFDPVEDGPHTGHVTAASLVEAGVVGSLLNHAEKKLPIDVLQRSVEIARNCGLFTIVCADTAYAGKALSEFDPDMVAIEPPELIGGDISVATAQPQIIRDAVQMITAKSVLVGAGIKTAEDVRASLKYGAMGVLVSSGIIRSLDPEKALNDLIDGFF